MQAQKESATQATMVFKQFAPRSVYSSSVDAPQNRQESHRIYLQVFAPHSAANPHASATNSSGSGHPVLHRHNSHEIHPPNYPMTAPGAPYQFPPSSDSSSGSTFASYTFSSVSTTPASSVTEPSAAATHMHNNRVRAQPSQPKPRFVGYPATSTTSAAVRLTDRARAKDVTSLLRGKFGLPPISINISSTDKNISHMQQVHHVYTSAQSGGVKIPSRLSAKSGMGYSSNPPPAENQDELDVLVLVATIERPPRGYIRFEHEEILEEQSRLESFRHYKNSRSSGVGHFDANRLRRQQQEARAMKVGMPVSESADTIRASGGDRGLLSFSQMAQSTDSFAASGHVASQSFSSGEDLANLSGPPSSTIGLDLSSSRGSAAFNNAPWGSAAGMRINEAVRHPTMQPSIAEQGVPSELFVTSALPKHNNTSPPKNRQEGKVSSPTLNHRLRPAPLDYEFDLEPIHVVRTIHPDEHPLQVRDEMMKLLVQMRREAEDEMGLRLHFDEDKNQSLIGKQLSQPTFRWFFQPCSAIGGVGTSSGSSKIQGTPLYIDLEGYCTGDDESDTNSDRDDCDADESKIDQCLSPAMNRLAKERGHVAVLRELSDATFILSGYLMKQSCRDPNVWRRVFCVLNGDRLWTVRRMKTLAREDHCCGNLLGNEDTLSSLRIGHHSYVTLHRSLLLEGGDGASDPHYSGQFISPLGHRLPNTFRLLPSNGSCHTFRAFDTPSFRVWTASLAEKIKLKHGDSLMDLANFITEDEILARSKRRDEIAVSSFLDKVELSVESPSELLRLPLVSSDITRFGLAVAEYKELCRHVTDAIQPQRNHGIVLNLQTQVGGSHTKQRTQQSLGQRTNHNEFVGMISAVWEDARLVASKSAQLLHTLAAFQRDNSDTDLMENLLKEQKDLQTKLGKWWDSICTLLLQKSDNNNDSISPEVDYMNLPPMDLFDALLDMYQSVCAIEQQNL